MATVDELDMFLETPELASDVDEVEVVSDSIEIWRSAKATDDELDAASGSRRRRTRGGGPSFGNEDRGGPRRKVATACDAKSYRRNSASSSLRRLPLLVKAEGTGCLPLLFAGATSLRLVKDPSG